MATIRDIRKKYHKLIAPLDLELLFSFVLGKPREFVLARPEHEIPATRNSQLATLIKRRIKGEPIAYILGKKEFYGLDFKVDRNTLIPRPETELIVDLALEEIHALVRKRLRTNLRTINIVDVGTGSGNILISILSKLRSLKFKVKSLKFFGIDISKKALLVAKQNAKRHDLAKKIKFTQGDLIDSMLKNKQTFMHNAPYIILANLPYLDTGWKNLLNSTETRGLKFEPSVALYAGKDGLDVYRKLAEQLQILSRKTSPPITVFCEIGHVQKQEMRRIFFFAKTTFYKDLAGKWRVCKIEI